MVTLAIWGDVTPGAILTKCSLWGDMVDVITYAIFRDCRLRGVGVVRWVSLPSPMTWRVALTTLVTLPCDRVMTRRHPRMCAFWGFKWPPTILRGSKPPKNPKKGAWVGIFQPKWQNYKIVISPAWNIGSIPNFDVVIEPHSWLHGWSRITKFIFKMTDRILETL